MGNFLTSDDAPWNLLMALSVIYSIPPVIFYYIFRRYLTHGLVSGAVQGTQRRGQALRRSASHSRAGVMGTRVISVPRSASASSTAFAMAAGGEMMPLSPTPLMPSSFRMEGKDIAMVSRGGRSAAGAWRSP
jgi:hypothetical protein